MHKNRILFLLIFIPYCAFTQEENPYDYLPSAVGNRWEYSIQGGWTLVHEIYKDSIDVDGSRLIYYSNYFIENSPFNDPDPYFRIDSSFNVFLYPTYEHLNFCYYKLDADSGDTWWVKRPDSSTSGERAFVTKVYDGYVFGEIREIKRIEYWQMSWEDSNETNWLNTIREIAYGLGKIYEFKDAEQPDFLVGAVIDGDTLGTITSVEQETTSILPSRIVLYQNYPNPFNPETTISYSLTEPGYIKISVYDILGQEVAELYNGRQIAGLHEIKFNSNSLSLPMASGIYIYTIITQYKSISKKMILLQ